MKKLSIKFIVSILALATVFVAMRLLDVTPNHDTAGEIRIILEDVSGQVVYDAWIPFESGMSFFDLLQENFEITCANALYQPDETCGYTFQSFGVSDKVILGIRGTSFELMTNWQNTYLSIHKWDGSDFRLTPQGVMNLPMTDQDQIKITVKEVW